MISSHNWLIAGTDAHAKNYALLIGAESRILLAPLYDVASVLPYPDININKVKLSMKLGGEYVLRNIRLYHWKKMAVELRIEPDRMVTRVHAFAEQLAHHITEIRQRMTAEGITHLLVARLADALVERSVACQKTLRAP